MAHIDSAYYYLACAIATVKFNEVIQLNFSADYERLMMDSYKFYIAAQEYRTETDDKFQPPIVQQKTEYVYLIILDVLTLRQGTPLTKVNTCARVFHHLLSLKSIPVWSAWVNAVDKWVKLQTAEALAMFINEQYNTKHPTRRDAPDIYAKICVETLQLLSYSKTQDALRMHAETSLSTGYKNHTENYVPTVLGTIISGKFYETRNPPSDIFIEATLETLVPYYAAY